LDQSGKVPASQLPAGSGGESGPVDWTDIENKPKTFPPSGHTHQTADVSGLSGWMTDAATLINTKVSVSDLTTALSTKASSADLTTGLSGKANVSHTHTTAQVTGLDGALSGKASTSHTHATPVISFNDLTDKPATYPHSPIDWDDVQNKPTTFPSDGEGGGGFTPKVFDGYLDTGSYPLGAVSSWTPIAGLTLPIAAASGDRVEVALSGLYDRGSSLNNFLDLVVLVGGSIVLYASTGSPLPAPSNEGDPALYPLSTRYQGFASWAFGLAATSSEISGGQITFGIAYRGDGGAKLFAEPNYVLRCRIRNDGPN
jgi:hypothetical protein